MLKKQGFSEDTSPNAPICRWKHEEVILDVMPTDPQILGFGNRWFARAFSAAQSVELPSGRCISLLPAPYFLATKLEAFDNRGGGDYLMSRDMEDIVVVLDGRPEVVEEVRSAEEDLKSELKNRFSQLSEDSNFRYALSGLLPPDAASQARVSIILVRMKSIRDD